MSRTSPFTRAGTPMLSVPAGEGHVAGRNISMDIENIINAIRNSWVIITDYADEEAFDDNLTY